MVRVGLLGCGTVGGSFCELVAAQRSDIESHSGLTLEITAVAVRNLDADRPVARELLTLDARAVATSPDVDVVVETMGGIEPTREIVLSALAAGKPVVTANKELLAHHGAELYAAADTAGVDLLFEASVAAGIPLIRPLRESLAGERISRIMGILNGTTNYILSQMTEHGAEYSDALAEAQELGFAEADPTADVEGHDAASKVAILATLAFGQTVTGSDVFTEGIAALTSEDISNAARLGHVIKLLGIVEMCDDDRIAARVHPAMVPTTHPLASVRDSFNAVYVEGAGVDQLMFYGRGAGGYPTAAMMLGDTIDAGLNVLRSTHRPFGVHATAAIRPMNELRSAFYVSLDARDEPGVLAAIASVFGEHGVSIQSMEQLGLGDQARLIFITHEAVEGNVRFTLADLYELDVVKNIGQVIRVVGTT